MYIKLMILVCYLPIFADSIQTLKILNQSLTIWNLILALQLCVKHGLLKKKLKVNQENQSYQNYHGDRGSSIKSGCSFYVEEVVKFKPRKDLDIAYHDTDSELQSTCIEIFNGKKPNIIIGAYYRHSPTPMQSPPSHPKPISTMIFLHINTTH